MDLTLTGIVRGSGYNFQSQFDFQENWNSVVYKFVSDTDLTEETRKSLTQAIINALNAAKFKYTNAGFQRNERAQGPDYWAFAIAVPSPLRERPLDRDKHGNLIFVRTKQRVPGT